MKPITEETTEKMNLTLNYSNVTEFLSGKVILTQDEYQEGITRAFLDGRAVGYEVGYQKGLMEMPPTEKLENAACVECWRNEQVINSDYCADCQPKPFLRAA